MLNETDEAPAWSLMKEAENWAISFFIFKNAFIVLLENMFTLFKTQKVQKDT